MQLFHFTVTIALDKKKKHVHFSLSTSRPSLCVWHLLGRDHCSTLGWWVPWDSAYCLDLASARFFLFPKLKVAPRFLQESLKRVKASSAPIFNTTIKISPRIDRKVTHTNKMILPQAVIAALSIQSRKSSGSPEWKPSDDVLGWQLDGNDKIRNHLIANSIETLGKKVSRVINRISKDVRARVFQRLRESPKIRVEREDVCWIIFGVRRRSEREGRKKGEENVWSRVC